MTQINSYLTFNGNCREAMTFYKECLGGELEFQTIGESPMAEKYAAPNEEKHFTFDSYQGRFSSDGFRYGSERGLMKGNAVSLNAELQQ